MNIDIEPAAGATVALTPLKMFSKDANVYNQLQIKHAHLLFAPLGGTEADGTVVQPGVGLDFAATIAGINVNVAASVSLDPANPSITADASIDSFSIGPVSFNSPRLHLAIAPIAADLSISGGFHDSTSGIELLRLGRPGRLDVVAQCVGRADDPGRTAELPLRRGVAVRLGVHSTAAGSTSPHRGTCTCCIGSSYLNLINFTYSVERWRALARPEQRRRGGRRCVRHRVPLGRRADQPGAAATRLRVGRRSSRPSRPRSSWVRLPSSTGWSRSAYSVDSAVQTAINTLSANASQIASALQNLGLGGRQASPRSCRRTSTRAPRRSTTPLLSIGDSGSSMHRLDQQRVQQRQLQPVGRDRPRTSWTSAADRSDAGAPVIQYTLNFGTNQDWYVLPTDSGYAELVNRNSGQCLADPNYATGPTGLVQMPCTGDADPAVVSGRLRRPERERADARPLQPVQRPGRRRQRRVDLAGYRRRAVLRERREQPELDLPSRRLAA